jgi:alcohol dehydrogenase class IV
VLEFIHRSPASRVVFRPGALAALPAELDLAGIRRPLVISGKRTAASALFKQIPGEYLRVLDVPEHSSVETVERIAGLAREQRVDGFVAVGGGSASDTAKAAAILLGEGGRLEDHASRFSPPASLHVPVLKAPKLPVVAVPCTASGAEVTPGLGIRAGGRKLLFTDLQVASRLILIDPEANVCVPAALMLSTGMNGLAHCIEGLYSRIRTPVTDALCLYGIDLFADALPRVWREPESVEARAALLAAAHVSGLVLLNARTCLHHAICHALGALTGVPHGAANAVMLPHAAAFNHSPHVTRIRELQADTGVPTTLRELNVPRHALAQVAEKVMEERGVYFNPRPVPAAAVVEQLLEEAW